MSICTVWLMIATLVVLLIFIKVSLDTSTSIVDACIEIEDRRLQHAMNLSEELEQVLGDWELRNIRPKNPFDRGLGDSKFDVSKVD
ncbi:hypothetical protein BOTCAL_0579g00050 [Botryotinia calthae]|uniref:Uncharacterized protein n=1 Tax=Botryotinia calthae TaxID=38488 RepID=A0A4Y8CM34_9HELO|nr:hypothetical protein BOTCAL_0579g00050 [Botryotinia calthae]